MTEPRDRNPQGSIGVLLLAAAFIPVGICIYLWPWLDAWITHSDLSERDRKTYFNEALNRDGVPARLDRGGMAILRRSDVADIGASKCARALTCARSGRRTCRDVTVTFSCTFAVRDRSGRAATALLELESDPRYELGVNSLGSPSPFSVRWLDLNEADRKLCELADRCGASGASR